MYFYFEVYVRILNIELKGKQELRKHEQILKSIR